MPRVSRRCFLGAGAALISAPFVTRAERPSNPDVVVIGAGAAGLAAARSLLESGRTVTLIEAASRIGGRAHTDQRIFGVPYDLGAHWLHMAERNPFVSYAKQNGFDVYPAPSAINLYVGDRPATKTEHKIYDKEYRAAIRAISNAGRSGQDVSPASIVKGGGEWHDTAHFTIGGWEMGKDYSDFSCVDWWNSEDGTDWYCKQGYGAVLAHSAARVPVELQTKAQRIRWGGPGVVVQTDRGDIAARACILTVSTGVLASGRIRFEPALPARKQEAFNGISMGLYNHIAFQFKSNIFGTSPDAYVLSKVDSRGASSPRGMGLLTNVSGTSLSIGDVGGGFARELEHEGLEASVDFGLSELRKLLGADVDRELIKTHTTQWGRNPWTLGSYASAAPGAYPMRRVLRETVADRIWFAGEACSTEEWATVGGAHKTGLSAAKRVLSVLNA